ncbi:flagellar hook-length control protein FliK [uncultured Selenomonas sp.]|jgi:flagellar hook-length control protein fliK|uniref:flagellar hook-length control protein FliK n=1 Tax=uncultured Selenomonas sp. TaxID=159275 RepID=UPI0028D4A318|nr:flagellar hook-length control protein FliK [uncultured Selenomonas sp.]
MNDVQVNLMNVAPAPNTTMKANAVEAVRPASQAGTTADRGAKNPSFDKTLAKLKTLKQSLAEAVEGMEKDPLAASLAASQQTKQADLSTGNPAAEAVETVEAVEGDAAVKNFVAVGEATQLEASILTALPASVEEVTGSASIALPDEAAIQQGDVELSPQDEMPVDETKAAVLQDKVGAGAAKMQEEPQNKAADINHLAALLSRSEKPEQDLLRALPRRTLLPASQIEADIFTAESMEASLLADMNLAEADAELPDALLRTLARQPMTSVTTGTTENSRQTAAPSTLNGEATPLPVSAMDTKVAPMQSANLAEGGQDLTQSSSNGNFAGFFNEQQAPQDDKAQENDVFFQTAATQALGGSTAKPKASSAMQLFTEAAQTPQGVQEVGHASQANPSVTFQTALQETAEVQPTAPAAPQKDYEVARQIVEQARLLRMPEQTEMVIRLKPEHLGELTLKVSVAAGGAVNATFHTDNASVRAIIETSMIQLKHELQAQGLKVDNVGVYAGLGDNSLMDGQQDANARYAQHSGQGSSQGRDAQQALASFEEEQQALAANAQQGVLAQDGVDYRV